MLSGTRGVRRSEYRAAVARRARTACTRPAPSAGGARARRVLRKRPLCRPSRPPHHGPAHQRRSAAQQPLGACTRATPPPRARPCGRPRTARRGRPSTRGSAAAGAGQRRAPASASHGTPSPRSRRARPDASRPACRTPGRRRPRLDHREAEALVLRRDDHGVGGVDPVRDLLGRHAAQGEQRDVAGRLARAVDALERPRRLVREQQVRPGGVEAEAGARLGARDRPEARRVDADGQHRDAAASRPAPGTLR